MTDERQKKTTEQYRSNWDAIFKKKITEVIQKDNRHDNYQDILSTEDCVINALDTCCNHDCNQGRACPRRSK